MHDCTDEPAACSKQSPSAPTEEARRRLEAPRPPKPMKRVGPGAEASPRTNEGGEAGESCFGSEQALLSTKVRGWSKRAVVRPIARSLPDLAIAAVEAGAQATFPAQFPLGQVHTSPSQAATTFTTHRSPSPPGPRSLLASAGALRLPTACPLTATSDTEQGNVRSFMPVSARGVQMPEAGAGPFLFCTQLNSRTKRASSAQRRPPTPSRAPPVSARTSRDWCAVKINAGG